MKKVKLLFLFTFVCLLSGCTAEYNVEIYNDEVRVDSSFVEKDSSKWDELVFDTSYREIINWKTTGDESSPVAEGIYKISSDNELGIGLKNKYQLLGEYENSPGIKACYQYFKVIEEDENIILSTSLENKCFDEYPMLDDITINLKTNHKVVSSNADLVDGYHYTWNLSRENKDDAAILITIKKDEYIFNYENEFLKKILYTVGIIVIIVGVGGITYLYFKNKRNTSNEI